MLSVISVALTSQVEPRTKLLLSGVGTKMYEYQMVFNGAQVCTQFHEDLLTGSIS